jgi:uncharacterized protein (DUF58 family)
MARKTTPLSPQHTTKTTRMVDPDSLMKIKSIELRAKVIVEGFWQGIHRSPFRGFSVEFTEYRPYTPGDDPRYIDWRLYARTDRLHIKMFEDETNLRCHLLVDHSRSMGYGSGAHTKAQYAATLAATLAYFLFNQGDAVGLALFDDAIQQYLPCRNRPNYLHRLMLALEAAPQGRATDLGRPLQHLARMLKRRGLIVLVSDLLTSIDRLEWDLGTLYARGHDVIVFQVLDPAELNLDFDTPALFQDLETGRDMYVDPAAAQEGYKERLSTHLAQVERMCRGLGIGYYLFDTNRPFDEALLDFMQQRMRTRKQIRRTRKARTGGTP